MNGCAPPWLSLSPCQGLSLSTDSAPKKLRKEAMERELAEIERDIRTLERGEVVLVVED